METTTLLSVQDAAARLAVSPRTIWKLLHSGRISSVRVASCRRIRSDEVDRFIAGLPSDGCES